MSSSSQAHRCPGQEAKPEGKASRRRTPVSPPGHAAWRRLLVVPLFLGSNVTWSSPPVVYAREDQTAVAKHSILAEGILCCLLHISQRTTQIVLLLFSGRPGRPENKRRIDLHCSLALMCRSPPRPRWPSHGGRPEGFAGHRSAPPPERCSGASCGCSPGYSSSLSCRARKI